MASVNQPIPGQIDLKDCPRPGCNHAPQVFPAVIEGKGDVWAIVCPECGLQLVGRRIDGFALGRDHSIIPVLKPGDDLEEMAQRWNSLEAEDVEKGGAA